MGERQPPGPLGVGGIDDHRLPRRHGLHQALVQPLLDIRPGPLHRGIDDHH